MAKTIYSQGDKIEYGIKVYVVDTEEDRQNLTIRSAKMGSKCYVIGTKKWYILNGSFEWDPFVDAGGSGNSGSPFDIKGSVATSRDLPAEGNAIGDLYIVRADYSEWVWLTSEEEPSGYWEQLGSAISSSDIVEATEQMTAAQGVEIRENLGAEPEKFVVTVFRGRHGWESDKTLAEITQAYESGKIIVVFSEDENLFYILSGHDSSEFLFVCVLHGLQSLSYPERVELRELKIDSSGWTESIIRVPLFETIVDVQSTTPTIEPPSNTIYKCGTLTSLTISNPPAQGAYSIVFTSGATATTTTIPATILGLEDFAAEANTMYEINVLDNRAVVGSWEVSV